jgi:predicted membrane channel-forming protein YqfA (hemolysin III family)
MKNRLKKYSDLIYINLGTLIVSIFLIYYFGNRLEIIGAVLATGISLSIGVRQYKIENDKMFKELFEAFNKKYDCKFNNRFNQLDELLNKDPDFTLKDEVDRLLIIDYLNFCSEEYLWYTKGRVPEIVWNSWEEGMLYFLNLKPINQVVQIQKIQKNSYYGLFEKLGKKLK